MPSSARKFGDLGERIAREYFIRKGYLIVEQNYQKPWGEIDIVMKKDGLLVFCEVKTRDSRNIEHYLAEYSVNKLKIKRLQKICEIYLTERQYHFDQKWQIDVLSVSVDKSNKKAKIKHIENAIWEKPY